MVKNDQTKRQRSIKSKLMAAVCMLLVSCIMMVSSTYAWFTLSTAPEVTGITTAVGANGNLEMALMPKDGLSKGVANNFGITSGTNDSTKAQEERNVTWGNLVDLSAPATGTIYGLDKIVLQPAEGNINFETGTLVTEGGFLKTPKYGADGRVSELVANTLAGHYSTTTKDFYPNDEMGVRGIGTASGMTPRQLAYRNARATANTLMAQAKNLASQSLNNNGAALANVALKKAVNDDPTFNQADVASLQYIVYDLLGYKFVAASEGATHYQVATEVEIKDSEGVVTGKETYYSYHKAEGTGQTATHKLDTSEDGVIEAIENAYVQYIYAYVISNNVSGSSDALYEAFKTVVDSGATLQQIYTKLSEELAKLSIEMPATISAPYTALVATRATVEDVYDDLDAMTGDSITWTDLSVPLYKLADTDAMKVNDIPVSEVKSKMSQLVSSVTSGGGLVVKISTGGGVYADIADHCTDYNASITINEVSYSGVTLNNMSARMTTESTVSPAYLVALGTAVEGAGAPPSASGTTLPITDMYGYVIDLVFRTNAAESKLMLQQEGVDRIYGNNTNEQTLGHGASMTFKATTNDFSNDQVKELMRAIRLVFFNPLATNGNIIVYGMLDVASATVGSEGITAQIVLCEMTTTTTYTKTTDTTVNPNKTYYTRGANDVMTKVESPAEGANPSTLDYYEVSGSTTALGVKQDDPTTADFDESDVIMPLTQNQATPLSVLVYLDGNHVGNEDVAATAAQSMTGSMNLQFSSSAALVPMEYADLHIPSSDNTQAGE